VIVSFQAVSCDLNCACQVLSSNSNDHPIIVWDIPPTETSCHGLRAIGEAIKTSTRNPPKLLAKAVPLRPEGRMHSFAQFETCAVYLRGCSMPKKILVSVITTEKRIHLIRGQRVILDADLSHLYDVETKALKRAVRRNKGGFPDDFMFVLSPQEYLPLRWHFGTLKLGQHTKYLPSAFSEQGVAMLSSVLNSNRAVKVNIAIMRAFVRFREIMGAHKELMNKLEDLERKSESHDVQIRGILEAITHLMEPEQKPRRQMGFDVKHCE